MDVEVDQFFRAGVGALIINEAGLVLVAERSDIGSAWQAPQGGIEHGERPIEALQRELREELGIGWNDVEFVSEYDEWLAYELPEGSWSAKTGRGQAHRWFLLRLVGNPPLAHDDTEFARHRWVTIKTLVDDSWVVRRHTYQRLADDWAGHFTKAT
jgi:putative (di)nucleoside polyphosphate hydrolase